MNIYDFLPNTINPILVSRLEHKVEAAILLTCIQRFVNSDADDDGWICFQKNQLIELTGLTKNKLEITLRYLKKQNLLEVRRSMGIRHYKIDSSKFQELLGYKLTPSLIKKVQNNAGAALLLSVYLDKNTRKRISLLAEIPSREIGLLTGMDKKTQIYARDSLISKKFLRRLDPKTNLFDLNFEELIKSGIIEKTQNKLIDFEH